MISLAMELGRFTVLVGVHRLGTTVVFDIVDTALESRWDRIAVVRRYTLVAGTLHRSRSVVDIRQLAE